MTTPERLARALRLIVITDGALARGRAVVDVVAAAIRGGAGAIQLRSKTASAREMVQLGHQLSKLARQSSTLLFVNDRIDVALAVGADGAHLGSDDLPLPAARAIAPAAFLLGRSVDTADEARVAEREGADYLGAGPVYGTTTKADTGPVLGIHGVAGVCQATRLPVVAIGGIDVTTAVGLSGTGAAGIAVVRGVMAAADPEMTTRQLLHVVTGWSHGSVG